ncbi:MAG: signal peptidase I [Bryobacterales bacterium]|nr:signal peptidase I [Bryobacterales bacterium]
MDENALRRRSGRARQTYAGQGGRRLGFEEEAMNETIENARNSEHHEAVSAPPASHPRRSAIYRWVGTASRDLGLSVVIAFLIIVFLYQPVKVEGTSMMPSIGDQQRIFVDKLFFQFGFSEIHRGDVVVFWFPLDQRISYIKRVVGLPGDRISVKGGVVRLNGSILREPYVPAEFRDEAEMPEIRLGKDEYFVLGDHRNSSNDSRMWGPVAKHFIYGKAIFTYWPLDQMKLVR